MGRGLKKISSNLRKCFIYGQKKVRPISRQVSSGGSVEYTLTLKHRERYRRDMYHAS